MFRLLKHTARKTTRRLLAPQFCSISTRTTKSANNFNAIIPSPCIQRTKTSFSAAVYFSQLRSISTTTTKSANNSSGIITTPKPSTLNNQNEFFSLQSASSMLVTGASFSWYFGPNVIDPIYGIGIVGLIGVHELGHAIAAKHYNVPCSPMKFVPFIGGFVKHDIPKNAYENAMIALGGPIVGAAGALGVAGVAHATGSHDLQHIALIGLFINGINLAPLGPLD